MMIYSECQAISPDSSNTVSVVIAQVAQAMLLTVQHLVLSATMLCFHLPTRYILLVHRRRHVFSGCNIQGEEETMIGSQHAEFMGPTWSVVKYQWHHVYCVLYMLCHLLFLKLPHVYTFCTANM